MTPHPPSLPETCADPSRPADGSNRPLYFALATALLLALLTAAASAQATLPNHGPAVAISVD